MPADYDSRVEIELLKKDVSIITTLCEKFDTTIDKMQEIASNLSKMVALQELRLEAQEKLSTDLQSRLEMRRIEHNSEVKELNTRMTDINTELTEKIEETEKKILRELQLLREEMMNRKAIETKPVNSESQEDKSLRSRLEKLEAWHYTVVGAFGVIIWVLAKIDLGKFIKGLF